MKSNPCRDTTYVNVNLVHQLMRICNVVNLAGVSMASLTELSFNWTGFISAMISNVSFTYRSIYSKKAMVIKNFQLFSLTDTNESKYVIVLLNQYPDASLMFL